MIAAPAAARQVRLAGPFQQLVMLALVRLGPDTPASAIHHHIQVTTGRRLSKTAVHTTLGRLAARGYTRSWTRPIIRLRPKGSDSWRACAQRLLNQASRRFHTLQTLGRRALRLTLAAEDVLRPGLPGLGHEEQLHSHVGPVIGCTRQWWETLPLNRRLRRLFAEWANDFVPPPEWLRLKVPRAMRPPPPAAGAA